MTQREFLKPTCIDYGVAAKPLAGEFFSGDAHLVQSRGDTVLLAVIDGIGHGQPAANAATAAITVLENHSGESLVELIKRCHRTLVNGRGVAMTIITIEAETNQVNWLGVGNVCGGLFSAQAGMTQRWKGIPSHSGIVGYHLPRLQPGEATIALGDWLVLTTDGVRADFDGEIAMNGPPQEMATQILSRYFRGNDDALVLTARYWGKRYE